MGSHSVGASASSAAVGFALFDATGTLMYLKEPVGETYCRFAKMHGLDVGTPQELDRRFKLNYKLAVCCRNEPRLKLEVDLFDPQAPLDYAALRNADSERVLREEREWWRALVLNVFETGDTQASYR